MWLIYTMASNEGENRQEGINISRDSPFASLLTKPPISAFLGLRLATITARLATMQAIIRNKNKNLEDIRHWVDELKERGNDIERNMTTTADHIHLINVYKQGLNVTQELLRQAMI